MGDVSESLVAKARAAYDQCNFEHSRAISLDCIKIMQHLHHHPHGGHLCSQLTACFLLAIKSWATLSNDTKLEQCATSLEEKLFSPKAGQCCRPGEDSPCLLSDCLPLDSSTSQFNGTLESFHTLATRAGRTAGNVPPLADAILLLRLCEFCLDADLYDYALNFSLQLYLTTSRSNGDHDGVAVSLARDSTETSPPDEANHLCQLMEAEDAPPSGLTEQVWRRLAQHYCSAGCVRLNGEHPAEPDKSGRVNHVAGDGTPLSEDPDREGVTSLNNHEDSTRQLVVGDLPVPDLNADELPIEECLSPSMLGPSTDVNASTAADSHTLSPLGDLSANEEQQLVRRRSSPATGYLNDEYGRGCNSDTTASGITCFYDDFPGSDGVTDEPDDSVGEDILVVDLQDAGGKQESGRDENDSGGVWTISSSPDSSGNQDVCPAISMIGDEAACVDEQAMQLDAALEFDADGDSDIQRRKSILKMTDKIPDSPNGPQSATKRVRFSLDPTHPSPAIEAAYGGRSNRRRLLDFARRRQQFELASADDDVASTASHWNWESDLHSSIVAPLLSAVRYLLHCQVVVFRTLLGYLGTAGVHRRRLPPPSPLTKWGLLAVFFCSCSLVLFVCYG